MSLIKSKNHNPNYLATLFQIDNIRKHNNADKLQIVNVNFQDVVTGLDAKKGDWYVFFPAGSKINKDFLSYINAFRDSELNNDKNIKGFFEKNGKVKAIKLRGERSMGFIVPAEKVFEWSNYHPDKLEKTDFDTINNILLVEKFEVKTKQQNQSKKDKKIKKGFDWIIENQVRLHVDTENFRNNVDKIQPNDIISVTYKVHGTSFWVANVLVKRKLNLIEKLLNKVVPKIVKIRDKEYGIVYGSRKVIKNKYKSNHFYGYDIWNEAKEILKDKIPEGFTFYGELVGFTKNGNYIQPNYDYGCEKNKFCIQIYRITYTNPQGLKYELSFPQIREMCERLNLNTVYPFYYGYAKNMYPDIPIDENWNKNFIERLEKDYNNKDCFMCVNTVPEEGIVIRKERLFEFEAYKLKSFRFLEMETK